MRNDWIMDGLTLHFRIEQCQKNNIVKILMIFIMQQIMPSLYGSLSREHIVYMRFSGDIVM